MNKKNILTFDCERTMVQFALFEMPGDVELIKGKIESIGADISKFSYTLQNKFYQEYVSAEKIDSAIKIIKTKIEKLFPQKKISAIGHRVVHGGEKYISPAKITDEVIAAISEYYNLAPLHNPYNLAAIRIAKQLWDETLQIACFDTAFHQTIPQHIYRKPLPEKFYLENYIRKYGFHGLFHNYALLETSRILKKPINNLNIISIYLSRGASVCAIVNGKSYDTSMGFTPLSGLMMTTRCGDLDAEIPLYLLKLGYTIPEVENILMKESGLLGVAKKSSVNDIIKNYKKDKDCKLAIDMFVVRIKKYIGSYYLLMNAKVDAIVFTGDISSEYPVLRNKIASELVSLGITVDTKKNNLLGSKEGIFSTSKSKIKLIHIPPNGLLIIARLVNNYLK